MRIRIGLSMFTLLLMASCGSRSDAPTPVPSPSPTPSAQDSQPAEDAGPDTPDGPTNSDTAPELPTTGNLPSTIQTPPPADEKDSTTAADVASLDADQLVARLQDANDRDVVTRQLVNLGAAAVEPLVGALKSDNWELRASAVFCLGQMGAAARPALPQLQEVAKSDENPAVRDAAAFAIDALEGKNNQP